MIHEFLQITTPRDWIGLLCGSLLLAAVYHLHKASQGLRDMQLDRKTVSPPTDPTRRSPFLRRVRKERID